MYTTIEEAELRYCILAMGNSQCEQRCEPDGCMAWRDTNRPGVGYCGLAGVPVNTLVEHENAG